MQSSLVDQLCAKDKIHSSIHQIFMKIYLTVSIGPSQKKSSTELFIKKSFFRWSPPALNLPTKIPPNRYMPFQRPTTLPLFTETSTGDTWTHSLKTNFLSSNPPQYDSNHQKQDLLITTSKQTFLVACLLRSAWTSTKPPLAQSQWDIEHQD